MSISIWEEFKRNSYLRRFIFPNMREPQNLSIRGRIQRIPNYWSGMAYTSGYEITLNRNWGTMFYFRQQSPFRAVSVKSKSIMYREDKKQTEVVNHVPLQ